MIVVLSDTHRRADPELTPAVRRDIGRADRVIHAGDLTTNAVLEALRSVAAEVLAVAGNRDQPELAASLPAARVLTVGDSRIAVTHRQQGGKTGLSYFGAEREADLVISGHTHRPHVLADDRPVLLNPGSHTSPRGGDPTYATLRVEDGILRGAIRTVAGAQRRQFRVEGRNGGDEE